ncbi:MAG: SAM-dependent chlorinase/fluorinase [Candidatus Hydrogenedentes bacterium]|nr:SAM-dependent chlorinase/fluorinase [Candidatus Hydrogenedentota bacterium]
MAPLITLTTDFGTRDAYAAVMKGVILNFCPDARVVELTHDIPPQDVFEGALFLAEAAPYFPPGTIHCVVVDPGVGTARLPIVVSAGDHIFACPDNGVLTLYTRQHPIHEARMITNPRFMRGSISATFHGRDIFAPAVAALTRGVPIQDAGERLTALTMLEIPEVRKSEEGLIEGIVMHVDHFGNAITNINRVHFGDRTATEIRIGLHRFSSVHETYGDVEPGHAVVLFGSSDYLEIAVHRGNARKQLGLARGTRVEVRF